MPGLQRPNRLHAALVNLLFLLLTWQGAALCAGDVGAMNASARAIAHAHDAGAATTGGGAGDEHRSHQSMNDAPLDGSEPCHLPDALHDCVSMPACATVPALPSGEVGLTPVAERHAETPSADRAPLEPRRAPEPPPPRT
jgi:hypothetical protein